MENGFKLRCWEVGTDRDGDYSGIVHNTYEEAEQERENAKGDCLSIFLFIEECTIERR